MAKLNRKQMLLYSCGILSRLITGPKQALTTDIGLLENMVRLDDIGIPEDKIEEVLKFLIDFEIDVEMKSKKITLRSNSKIYLAFCRRVVEKEGSKRKQLYARADDMFSAVVAWNMLDTQLEILLQKEVKQDG